MACATVLVLDLQTSENWIHNLLLTKKIGVLFFRSYILTWGCKMKEERRMPTKNSSIIKQGDDLIDWAIVSKPCRKKENGHKSPGLF